MKKRKLLIFLACCLALFLLTTVVFAEGEDAAAAEAVEEAASRPHEFRYLYDPKDPVESRIEAIAREVYGAYGVDYDPAAQEKLRVIEADETVAHLPICMAKTQYSLSHDPALRGRPRGWRLPIRDFLTYGGAGFVVPVCGDIKLMPGTASNPAFRNIDVDCATGKVKGLF